MYWGSYVMIGELIPDTEYPAMWRVVMPSGELSDLLKRQRAVELGRLLLLEQQNLRWAKQGKVA
jgi:hypothetical protein